MRVSEVPIFLRNQMSFVDIYSYSFIRLSFIIFISLSLVQSFYICGAETLDMICTKPYWTETIIQIFQDLLCRYMSPYRPSKMMTTRNDLFIVLSFVSVHHLYLSPEETTKQTNGIRLSTEKWRLYTQDVNDLLTRTTMIKQEIIFVITCTYV